MSKHRLVRVEVDGTRWENPLSKKVLFSQLGEVFRVDGSSVHHFGREIAIGPFWEAGEP